MKKGINGLGRYAAIAIRDGLDVAIKNQQQHIANCGALTHPDVKQSPASKEYFSSQIEKHKQAVEEIGRFRAEISDREWAAYQEEEMILGSSE